MFEWHEKYDGETPPHSRKAFSSTKCKRKFRLPPSSSQNAEIKANPRTQVAQEAQEPINDTKVMIVAKELPVVTNIADLGLLNNRPKHQMDLIIQTVSQRPSKPSKELQHP